MIAALLALATAALMKPVRWSFRIEPVHPTATVCLVDGSAPYRPGMLLVPGLYEVEVSAPGYVTRREWITHSESPTSHRIVLEGEKINTLGRIGEDEPLEPSAEETSRYIQALETMLESARRRGNKARVTQLQMMLDYARD